SGTGLHPVPGRLRAGLPPHAGAVPDHLPRGDRREPHRGRRVRRPRSSYPTGGLSHDHLHPRPARREGPCRPAHRAGVRGAGRVRADDRPLRPEPDLLRDARAALGAALAGHHPDRPGRVRAVHDRCPHLPPGGAAGRGRLPGGLRGRRPARRVPPRRRRRSAVHPHRGVPGDPSPARPPPSARPPPRPGPPALRRSPPLRPSSPPPPPGSPAPAPPPPPAALASGRPPQPARDCSGVLSPSPPPSNTIAPEARSLL